MLQTWLELEGYRCVTGYLRHFRNREMELREFVATHAPRLLLFDVGLPYEANWEFIQAVRQQPDVSALPIVLTTTNKAALEQLVGPTDALEILSKPYDLDRMTAVVRAALQQP